MKPISLWSSCAALVVFANTVYAGGTWEKITVPLNQYIVTIANQDKEIKPSCAFGQPYSFYFKPGKSKKLIVFLNGGGACWDYNTCASPLKAEILSTFVPDADISANDPNLRGGILDVKNPETGPWLSCHIAPVMPSWGQSRSIIKIPITLMIISQFSTADLTTFFM